MLPDWWSSVRDLGQRSRLIVTAGPATGSLSSSASSSFSIIQPQGSGALSMGVNTCI